MVRIRCSKPSMRSGSSRPTSHSRRSWTWANACRTAGADELEMLTRLGAKSIYIEYATRTAGRLDEEAYTPFREFLVTNREKRRGGDETELAARDAMTAFVNLGLPTDDIETIVRN